MSKTRNWFGASALAGSLGLVLLTSAMPQPAKSQTLNILGGGGGGGGGTDANGANATGGFGSGSYVGIIGTTTEGVGQEGQGTGGGAGGTGGTNTLTSKTELVDLSSNFTLDTHNGQIGGDDGAGGNGGSVTATLTKDTTIEKLILKAGNAGTNGTNNTGSTKGGNGGSVTFNSNGHSLNATNLTITSGSDGTGNGSDETGKAGGVTFIGDSLVASEINLTKNNGALNFNLGRLDASNNDVTITLEGTTAYNASDKTGVTFGELVIGMGHAANISGSGAYALSGLTIGADGQSFATSTIKSANALTFNSSQNLTFYIPDDIAAGYILLQNSGSTITLDNASIYIKNAENLSKLKDSDVVYLIKDNVTGNVGDIDIEPTLGAKEWNLTVAQEDGNLVLKIKDSTDGGWGGKVNQEKAKSYFQSNAATLNAVNFASDQVASQEDFVVPVKPQSLMDDVEIVAMLQNSGYGQRVQTGSYIKNSGMNILGGLGLRYYQQNGVLLANAFIEHGQSDYDTFTSTTHGYGNIQYTGAGIYAKQTFNSGFFVDASYRIGKVKSNYDSLDLNDGQFGDVKRRYYGWHVTAGQSFAITPEDATIIYARLIANTIDDFTVKTRAGENLAFDKASSFRSLLGARYEHDMSAFAKLYAGAAWEQEWDGKTGGTIDGEAINRPDFSGASAVFEVGGWFQAVPNMPGWIANAAIIGVTGKREEMSGKFGLGYRF